MLSDVGCRSSCRFAELNVVENHREQAGIAVIQSDVNHGLKLGETIVLTISRGSAIQRADATVFELSPGSGQE